MQRIVSLLQKPIAGHVLVLVWTTLALYVAACAYLQPPFDVQGDAPGYLEAMQVLNGAEPSQAFIPNRLLTTFGSVATVAILSELTGDYLFSWFFINSLYFFGISLASFFLFRRVTKSDTGAALGALFVVGNYDVVVFGLNYLADISGWFWFMFSLLFLFRYIETERRRDLWLAVLAAGVGGLFKEYAYLAFLPIVACLIYENRDAPRELIPKLMLLASALIPTLCVHVAVYILYGYTYFNWYQMGVVAFGFKGWLWNISRSLLVVLSLLLPIAAYGVYAFIASMRRHIDPKRIIFVCSLALPVFCIFLWPIITERLIFPVVPLAALLAAYAVRRHEEKWVWFGGVWILYVAIAFRTDGLILSMLYIW